MGTSGVHRRLENVEPKGQELASVEVSLPANFSIHKLRALMQKWHTLLVLSGGCFLFFPLWNINLLRFWFILAFGLLHSTNSLVPDLSH